MAEPKIGPVCPIVDPEERKRRLSRVYTILLDLAAEQEAAERESADDGTPPGTVGTVAAQD